MSLALSGEVDDYIVMDEKVVTVGANGDRACWRLVPIANDNSALVWKPYLVSKNNEIITKPAWLPLPGSQSLFLSCPIGEVLYEGTRGPGKTISLLLDFAREVGKGWGKAWRGILFRRELGDLDDVVRKIEDFFPTIWGDDVRFLRAKGDYACVWKTGETLLLRNLAGVEDYDQYHGHEYPWIGFEELTQWENDDAYMLMHSCSRPTRPGIPCRIRATTNPYGPGHNWVKKRFQLPQMRNKVVRQPGELPRIAIHGALRENFLVLTSTRMEGLPYNPDRIYEDSKYPIQIRNAAANDAQAQAWLTGDWNVTAGGMIDDVWQATFHVVPNFRINQVPRGWSLTRAYDHGQSHPFAVGWFLQSNGEPIKLDDGTLIGRKKGDLILWAEWYGVTKNANEGLRMPAVMIAQGILDREEDMGVKGLVVPGPADTEIWSKDNRGMNRSPADDMEGAGVTWERADKGAGSRKRGYELLRTMLMGAVPGPDGTRDKPGFFVCARCLYWIEIVPPTPRDPKNLDDSPLTYEDHLADMTRYRLSWSVPETWVRGF